ncbi:MAG: hypothetical protein EZS28_016865 [Streblomastix strix]|uniref:DDE-1 domain-containing protein n=1 Tax=Streblomastix strix TaxID=222440 RepID=A0A5J4VZD6_9EUKA|nr:MAG: hypothetical protein EZS28_016865 [Streblomastix strix]
MKGQSRYLNKQVIQGKKGVTNYYPRLHRRQEIRREFPRELKDRTSGMMLKVGWSAWNDNAEIRTLFCQSSISLMQRIIDKEMLSASCNDEYEEQIDE